LPFSIVGDSAGIRMLIGMLTSQKLLLRAVFHILGSQPRYRLGVVRAR
jgi:hypothetical protein